MPDDIRETSESLSSDPPVSPASPQTDMLEKFDKILSGHFEAFLWFLGGNVSGWLIFVAMDSGMYVTVLTIGAITSFIYLFVRHYSTSKQVARKRFLSPWAFSLGLCLATCLVLSKKGEQISGLQKNLDESTNNQVSMANAFKRGLFTLTNQYLAETKSNSILYSNYLDMSSGRSIEASADYRFNWYYRFGDQDFSNHFYSNAVFSFEMGSNAEDQQFLSSAQFKIRESLYLTAKLLRNATPKAESDFKDAIADLYTKHFDDAEGLRRLENNLSDQIRPIVPADLWGFIDVEIVTIRNRLKELSSHPMH